MKFPIALAGASILLLTLGAGCSPSTTPVEPVQEVQAPTTAPATDSAVPVVTSSTDATVSSTPTTTKEATSTPVVIPPAVKPRPKTAQPYETYEKAMKSYAFKYQFVDCHGTPGILNVKQNVRIMLDNRDGITRRFTIGKNTYTVKPYDFTVVNAPLPGTYHITCNGGGAAQLNVER